MFQAAKLGDVMAMVYSGSQIGFEKPKCWKYLGRAARLGAREVFLSNFVAEVNEVIKQVKENGTRALADVRCVVVFGGGDCLFRRGRFVTHNHLCKCGGRLFYIGKTLRGQIGVGTILLSNFQFHNRVGAARKALAYYEDQSQAARNAVFTWALVAKRIATESLNKVVQRKRCFPLCNARTRMSESKSQN